MGQIHKSYPVKLIMSIFTPQESLFGTIENILIKKFGPMDFISRVFEFNQTEYYKDEFGSGLKRKFISFKKLIRPEDLWKIKIITNALEDKFAKDNKRQINIDPGYISLANLVLATTKNFAHRIYIKNGVCEEVTLLFMNKTFMALPWTYPDYQTKEIIEIFIKIRSALDSQLKS
ncbi:MAG: DUF4416 family protein [Candidatus Omnitrophica bacterium]|nr:DUF4416 family protein [Candidatus Omnitrophota bacterium]